MSDKKTAALIIIGDEILRGQVQETNLKHLAQLLATVGIKINKVEIISDDCEEIAKTVRKISSEYTIVFTCGGVGPTHDDITYEGISEGLGLSLKENEELLKLFKKQFPSKPEALRLATIPHPSEIIYINSGNLSETSVIIKANNVYILPGSPNYFTRAVNQIVPTLKGGLLLHNAELKIESDEFSLVSNLDKLVTKWKDLVSIGSYPQYPDEKNPTNSTIITFEGNKENVIKCRLEMIHNTPYEHLNLDNEFQLSNANDVYNALDNSVHLKNAIDTIEKCFKKYKEDEIFISFNGGKDCTAVLYLTATVIYKCKLNSIPCLYVTGDSFTEVDDFVEKAANFYNVVLIKKPGPIKSALSDFLKERPNLKACLMGVRKNDPGSENQDYFSPTDPSWPYIIRVNPILDWSYSDVWKFLLQFNVPYCSLYDLGYTSIGKKSTTTKNPSLQDKNDPSKYLPAHTLKDDSAERFGRV